MANGRNVMDCQYVPFLSSIVSVVVVFDLLSNGLVFCLPILSVCAVCVGQFRQFVIFVSLHVAVSL